MDNQNETYAKMVVNWLAELGINNINYEEKMTLTDAVMLIIDRAEYGLAAYFRDKLEE